MLQKTKEKLVSIIKYLLPFAILASPLVAFAQACSNCVQSGLSGAGFEGIFGTGGLNSSTTLSGLIQNVISIFLLFAGAIAVVFVIIGGYQYLTSAGNEEAAEKGRKTLVNAIIGVIVVIMSYVIINVIVNLVSSGVL